MILSAPSKTFLVGEYAVLQGGPALLLNTTPRFRLKVTASPNSSKKIPFHSESPAGKLYTLHQSRLEHFCFEFEDPHQGKGGFGASSAQFILLQRFLSREFDTPIASWQSFKLLTEKTSGLSPSGCDVLSQTLGAVGYMNLQNKHFESLPWMLSDVGCLILRTGVKVSTHNHLDELVHQDFAPLVKLSEQIVLHFLAQRTPAFLTEINAYRTVLEEMNLVSTASQKLLSKLDQDARVLAAKGCGALGADVIILFVARSDISVLREELEADYEIVADDSELSPGIKVETELSLEREPDVGPLQ